MKDYTTFAGKKQALRQKNLQEPEYRAGGSHCAAVCSSWEVQCGQRVAASGISLMQ